jgi:porin
MYKRYLQFLLLLWSGFGVWASPALSQTAQDETLSGPDSHETGQGPHGHLFGDWVGERSQLADRGVTFDLQYVSDSLWNIKSEQKERFASWNRFRGTVDIDFGRLVGEPGLYFHATGRRQPRNISWAPYQPQRDVQREYMSPGFVVDREAVAG